MAVTIRNPTLRPDRPERELASPVDRFIAVSLWICALFLIYLTASEFTHLFDPGELPRLFFASRPSELQLNRRQRLRELLRLSQVADAHTTDDFRDPTSAAHGADLDPAAARTSTRLPGGYRTGRPPSFAPSGAGDPKRVEIGRRSAGGAFA
jgi:hypothetical protein